MPPLVFGLKKVYGRQAVSASIAASSGLALAAWACTANAIRDRSQRDPQFELINRGATGIWDDADDELDWNGHYADADFGASRGLGDDGGFV